MVDARFSARQTHRSSGGDLPQGRAELPDNVADRPSQPWCMTFVHLDLQEQQWCTPAAMVVTYRSDVAQRLRSRGQLASCQQLAAHHFRYGKSIACESRSILCEGQVQWVLLELQRAPRSLHRAQR